MPRPRTASGVVHYWTHRNDFNVLERDSVILLLLPGIVNMVKPEFCRFKGLTRCCRFEQIGRRAIQFLGKLKRRMLASAGDLSRCRVGWQAEVML